MRRLFFLLPLATVVLFALPARAQQEIPGPASPPAPAVPGAPPLQELPPSTPAGITPPTLTAEPTPAPPPLALDQRSTPGPQAARPEPVYRKLWFWGAIGVVLAVTAVILVTSSSSGPATPNTTLGDMRAF